MHDEIKAEMLRNLGQEGLELIIEIIKRTWNEGNMLKDWETDIILPIFKKGGKETVQITEKLHL